MTEHLHCGEVREAAFEYRKGELGEPRRALLDDHLLECAACASYVANVAGLLQAAQQGDGPLSEAAVESLWTHLEDALPDAPEPVAAHADATGRQSDGSTAVPRRQLRPVLAAAAMLALAALVWALWPTQSEPSATTTATPERSVDEPTEPTSPTERRAAADGPEVAEQLPNATPVPEAPPAPPALVRSQPHPALTVFAAPSTRWDFDADAEPTLTLEAGTLLLEALPAAGRRVFVRTPLRRIEIVGTVFFVEADDGGERVGVAAGTVRVTDERGLTIVLEDGAELDAQGAVVPLDPSRAALLDATVDLAAHRARLAERASAAPPEPPAATTEARPASRLTRSAPAPREVATETVRVAAAPVEPAPSPARPDPLALAELAQREGRFGDAVAILEALLDARVLDEVDGGLARLELARLYGAWLAQPRRALRQLQLFLVERPDDPAAPSALRELCQLADRLGEPEARCRDERAP